MVDAPTIPVPPPASPSPGASVARRLRQLAFSVEMGSPITEEARALLALLEKAIS